MIKYLVNLIFTMIITSTYAGSVIIETVQYNDIFQKIYSLGDVLGPKNVLVVFDVDDTLLVIDHCKKNDGTLTFGIGKLYSCPSVHAEENLSKEIANIQNIGYATMALTARGASLIAPTQRELGRVHEGKVKIDFNGKPFLKDFKSIPVAKTRKCKNGEEAPCLKGEISNKPRFIDGVMYANGVNKGLALKAILKKMKTNYKAVVFIDDRKKNTDNMHSSYKNQSEIEVVSFLYLRHRD